MLVRRIAFALTLAAAAAAQEPSQPAAPELTAKAVQATIAQLEADQSIAADIKAQAVEAYRAALADLEKAASNAQSEQGFRKLRESGPQTLQDLRHQLEAPLVEIEPTLAKLADLPVEDVERELEREGGRQTELQRDAADLATKIEAQRARPAAIREALAAATQRVRDIDREIESLDEPDATVKAARLVRLRAERAARTSEVQSLEQEQATAQLQLDLLSARRDMRTRELAQLEERLAAIQKLIADKRRAAVERARAEAQKAQEAAKHKHPALKALADRNSAFSDELAKLSKEIDSAQELDNQINAESKRVKDEFDSARDKLARFGLSDTLGDIFLEQSKSLRNLPRYRMRMVDYHRQIGGVRRGQLIVDQRLEALSDLDHELDEVVANADPPVGSEELPEFRSQARALLMHQAELLQSLDSTHARYLKVLGNLDFDQRQLEAEVSDFAGFLDDNLLWTPSSQPLDGLDLAQLEDAALWLVSPVNWGATANALAHGVEDHKVLSTAALLVLVLVIALRRWARALLETIAARVRRRFSDSFLLTISALLLTSLMAAPVPLLFGGGGWLLTLTTDSPSFPNAVGSALLVVAGILFALHAFALLMGEHGVARVHFSWHETILATFQRAIRWLLLLGLPAVFIGRMADAHEAQKYQESLGRLAFIFLMAVMAIFVGSIFSRQGGVLKRTLSMYPNGVLARMRAVWFPLVVVTPVALAALAGAGYYYTAIQLTRRLVASVAITVGAVLVHNLIVRWLVIARTKLAVARVREKRAAAEQAALAEEGGQVDVDLTLPEIDLATIKQHSMQLAKVLIVITTAVAIFGIWADILPALGVFDRELWESSTTVGGAQEVRAVTVGSLIVTLLVLVVTSVAARNLPGFLEVTLLRRLEAGKRYAFETMGQYLLVAAGVIFAMQSLGIAWSHVQWLVAALGVGIGFGLQEIFANFISGVILLVERPIRMGDTVTIGDVSGTVTRIRIRATTITDWDQKELVVPNKMFITDKLVNWSLSNPVTRLVLEVGIAYGSDTELALKLMMDVAQAHPKVLEEPELAVFFVGFGDSSLNFEVRVFVKELSNRGRTGIVHDLHLAIDNAFRQHGVVIAFPQLDVHLDSNEKA